MGRIIGSILIVFASNAIAANPPSILNNTDHAIEYVDAGLIVLGIPHSITAGPSSGTLAVNQTCSLGCGSAFVAAAQVISDALNTSKTEFAAHSTTEVTPLVPYQVISQSSTGYKLADYEQANYPSLVSGGLVYSMAYCGTPTLGDYPSVAFVTVLPNNSPETPVGGGGCGYAQGIEFSIPVNSGSCLPSCTWTPISGGLSVAVSTPSATNGVMSAVLAALKSNHPSWTWGDVKSVLRTTASNWPTGYTTFNANGPAYGYGNINYVAANSYVGQIYLQPPGFVVKKSGTNATFTLYPFVTSRRAGEVVYSFLKRPSFPNAGTNNEYSYAQISALVSAYGGQLAYNSSGAGGVQSKSYVPPTKATRYFVAFTVDNTSNLTAAKFSRAEEYLVKRVNFGDLASMQVIINSMLD